MLNAKWCMLSLVAIVLGLAPQGQEPQPQPARPAPAPADQSVLVPVERPYVEAVPRADLPERLGTRDPIEGFWVLRQRMVEGAPAEVGSGYMAIGRRHMIVQFQAPSPDPEITLLRAGVYTWRRSGVRGEVGTTVLSGHFNDAEGDVHIEQEGVVEVRQFELTEDLLRVRQGGADWLEFVRLE